MCCSVTRKTATECAFVTLQHIRGALTVINPAVHCFALLHEQLLEALFVLERETENSDWERKTLRAENTNLQVSRVCILGVFE